MDASLQVTLFFTAVFVVLSVPMSVSVGLRRAKTGISMLHGDDDDLLRRIRAHGNFVEYVPLALIALAGAEVAGAPAWFLMSCGTTLLVGRLFHYVAFRRTNNSTGRAIGAFLTSLATIGLGVAILVGLASKL